MDRPRTQRMPSERRLGPRRQLALDVMVNSSRRGLQRYRSRDISIDGVSLEEKADSLGLRRNSIVDLVLRIPESGKLRHHRVQARVAPVRKGGTRLIFRDLDEGTYTALVDLIYRDE